MFSVVKGGNYIVGKMPFTVDNACDKRQAQEKPSSVMEQIPRAEKLFA